MSTPAVFPRMGKVVHCRRFRFDLYIGRPFAEFPESIWANRYRIGPDGSREDVVKQYELDTRRNLRLMAAVPDLTGLDLGCWCYPNPCHGHVLLKLVQEYWEAKLGYSMPPQGQLYVAENQLSLFR